MASETRFFRSDYHTINGLSAHKLLASQSTSSASDTVNNVNAPLQAAIRVYKRTSSGVQTEITGGRVAVVTYVSDGLHSATWNCPQTTLAVTDAIVVKLCIMSNDHWVDGYDAWITEQLGATQLDAATWTVWYFLTNYFDDYSWQWIGAFLFGDLAHNSRIVDFTWSNSGSPSGAARLLGDGLAWVDW